MNDQVLTTNARIRVTSYSPFRNLRGTIKRVNAILGEKEGEDIFCFYLIAFDSLKEPIWFEHTEVEPLDASVVLARVS